MSCGIHAVHSMFGVLYIIRSDIGSSRACVGTRVQVRQDCAS